MDIFNKLQVNPDNPRTIKTEDFTNLKDSLKEDPWMLVVKPVVYNSKFIIQAGNMRFLALKELEKEGFEIKDDYFKFIGDLTQEQIRRYVIKDNWSAGDNDYEVLANKWDDLPLEKWGIDPTGWNADLDNIKSTEDREEKFREQTVTCPKCEHSFTIEV